MPFTSLMLIFFLSFLHDPTHRNEVNQKLLTSVTGMDIKQWEVDDTNKLTAKASGALKRLNEVREQYVSKQECPVINETN